MKINYTYLELETKTNKELGEEKKSALELCDYYMGILKLMENHEVTLIINKLDKVERYIRRIDNLVKEYENDLGYVRNAIARRRLKLMKRGVR